VPAAGAADGPDRYSLAGGCYALQPAGGGFIEKDGVGYDDKGPATPRSEAFRMQATTLGRYLLYGRDSDFLAAGSGDAVAPAATPSPAADWRVVPAGDDFELRNSATDRPLVLDPGGEVMQGTAGQSDASTGFSFARSSGCATYPEVQLNATGKPQGGSTPFTQTTGMADMHNHVSAFEFLGGRAHCGKPWDAYGAPYALVDCPDHYPDGRGAILENLFYGDPTRAHDPVGWPTFKSWPAYDSLTHEQTYYRWIQRAWMGGERLMVNNLVENGVLCRVYPYKQNSCDEMDAVRLQAHRMYELQDYIDAQAGGPGEGFFRIVRNPFQARRVINQGKLAVVLGIEESELFGCTEFQDQPQCTIGDVKAGIDEVRKLGVSSFYPVHKFDNAFGGTRFDAGPVGAVINGGQFTLSGHFWEVKTCTGDESDNTIEGATPLTLSARAAAFDGAEGDVIDSGLAQYLDPVPTPPVYPPAPHCNVRGLTDLGRQLIDLMVKNHLLVEVDHMSVKTRNAVLDILDKRGYSGVLSGHEWSDKHSYKKIWELGGMVGGRADDVEGFVGDFEKYSPMHDPRYFFGWGYGPDANGLGDLPKPSEDAHPVTYPFKSLDGDVTLNRQVSGERTFDVNTDGTAHYGLLPDWFEDLRLAAGNDGLPKAMLNGSEAYLETWERAYGVPSESCRPAKARFTRNGLGELRIRRPAFNVLKKGGQPSLRRGSTYRYCVRGGKRAGQVVVAFSKRGRTALVAGSGKHQSAGGISVGDDAGALGGAARMVSPGLWIERHPPGKRRFVYGTRGGHVSFAGVASRPATHSKKALKGYVEPLR
jgi:hypothetical protein